MIPSPYTNTKKKMFAMEQLYAYACIKRQNHFWGAINICSKQKVNNFQIFCTDHKTIDFCLNANKVKENKKNLSSRIIIWLLWVGWEGGLLGRNDHHLNDYLQNFCTLHSIYLIKYLFIYLPFSWLVFVYLFVYFVKIFRPFISFVLFSF